MSYQATALRPEWARLPVELRSAIGDRLGAPVLAARTATAGFTSGFAAVLDTGPPAGRVFVKAADLVRQPDLAQAYANEAAILQRLPAGLPVPRLRWSMTAAGHVVLCVDAVDAQVPTLPWQPAALTAALDAYAEVAAALAEPPAELVGLGLPTLSALAREDLRWWREIRAGREPVPELPAGLAQSVTDRLVELVALESLLPEYAESGGLVHGDLRVDNVLLEPTGRAWICDWNWLCHGPAWFDLATLLLTASAGDRDVDAVFARHPAAADAPPDALDAALAALSGYFLVQAGAGATPGSPHLRSHQRLSGSLALAWLARRQGWAGRAAAPGGAGRFGSSEPTW